YALAAQTAPEFCSLSPSSNTEGAGNAGECRVLAAPAATARKSCAKARVDQTGSAETSRRSLRSGFTAYFALFPVNQLVCHRRLCGASAPQDLAPAWAHQNHTTSSSAKMVVRLTTSSRSPHPAPNVRDDAYAPQRGGTA